MPTRVLVVEDSPTQAELVRGALADAGFDVTVARNGEDGLTRFDAGAFDIVVTDIVMPGMVDGYELCRRIKSGRHGDTPVVLLTSLSDPLDVIRGLSCGADSFYTKTVEVPHLIERLNALLATRGRRATRKLDLGLNVTFMGHEFTITSEREQILNLLVCTFEDAVRQNQELRQREEELRQAKEQLAEYAGSLEHDVARGRADLRLADERLRQLMEALPDATIVVDQNGTMIFASTQTEAMFGYGRHELLGRKIEMLVPEGARDRHEAHRAAYTTSPLARAMGAGLELAGRRKDGSEFPVEASLSPARTREGLVVTVAIRDISDRRAIEAQLRQAQKMEAVGQLTGGIAHDFNNILTVVLSDAELIAGALPPDAPLRQEIDEIQSAARRGAAMVAQLLRFSRRGMLTLRPLVPATVIENLQGMLRRLLPESVTVTVVAEDRSSAVLADAGALEQVLFNLCTNARDAMPDGGSLRIECTRTLLDAGYHATHPWVAPGEYVCVSVADDGVGMDEHTQQRLFEPFFTTKPPGVGTGLGMAMVYGLMKQHGGMVHVYSEPGHGTVVKLYFPITTAPTRAGRAPRRADREPAVGGTETILLAEDEVAIRRATRRALEKQGYTVLVAADGEEALDIYRKQGSKIHLVISDLVMPKLGGRQLAEALRSENPDVKIVFTSGYSPGSDYQHASFPAGAIFLHKPWTLADLFRTVRETLDAPGPGEPSETAAPPS
jgi:PAS domain S-box-containing protein